MEQLQTFLMFIAANNFSLDIYVTEKGILTPKLNLPKIYPRA